MFRLPRFGRQIAIAAALVGLMASSFPQAASALNPNANPEAFLNASEISLDKISEFHCHDANFPRITCFRDEADRDADFFAAMAPTASLAGPVQNGPEVLAALGFSYTTMYTDWNYGGGSYMTGNDWPNLGSIGWNDRVSSFKTFNNGRPRWFDYSNYGGISWMWGTNQYVSFVGFDANDRFSSVYNYN